MNHVTQTLGKRNKPTIPRVIFAVLAAFILGRGILAAQAEDVTPPSLEDFSFTPTAIDTSMGEASVTVTLHATDSESGVSPSIVSFHHPPTGQASGGSYNLVAGTLNDGIFQAQVTFPQGSAAGTWVARLILRDRVGNGGILSEAALAAMASPPS